MSGKSIQSKSHSNNDNVWFGKKNNKWRPMNKFNGSNYLKEHQLKNQQSSAINESHDLNNEIDEFLSKMDKNDQTYIKKLLSGLHENDRWLPIISGPGPYRNKGSYHNHNSPTKNLLRFDGKTNVKFNLDTDNFSYIQKLMELHYGKLLSFNNGCQDTAISGKEINQDTAISGKEINEEDYNKLVYNKVLNDLLETVMIKLHEKFMDVNIESPFWKSDVNIKHFVIFIAMSIESGCQLPYHFVPAIFEKLKCDKLKMMELEYFVKNINKQAYETVKNLDPDNFKLQEIGFENHEEYYRSLIIGKTSDDMCEIYREISRNFEIVMSFDVLFNLDILLIDAIFSGSM